MNNRAASTPLTWFMIAMLAFITVISLILNMQNEFYNTNTYIQTNDSYGPAYSAAYNNITANYNTLSNAGQPSSESITSAAFTGISNIFTTTVIGLSAISQLLVVLPGITKDIVQAMSTGPLALTLVAGFLMSAAGIYIAFKIIQALRGTNVET